jgi:hypothetical protein
VCSGCPLDGQPCHGDVLLCIANSSAIRTPDGEIYYITLQGQKTAKPEWHVLKHSPLRCLSRHAALEDAKKWINERTKP